ncbi:MAG TPA: PadR family transcriptional regulator [Acidimicrobiales bacterium]
MTHRDHSDRSAIRRDRNAQGRDANPWADRSGDRRRHGPHRGGHHDEGRDGEFSVRGGRGRGRRQRGDVRFAILALLSERPMHGYEMMQELAERSRGLWRPSPGSLYPALSLLEDQGFVRSQESEGRRQFTLTDEGRQELEAHPRASAPWEASDETEVSLRAALKHVAIAVHQVSEAGTTEQRQKAEALLTELRRQMYLLLAESLTPREDA